MLGIRVILFAILNDCKKSLDIYYDIGIKAGIMSVFSYSLIILFQTICFRKYLKNNIRRFFIKIPFIALLGFYCYLVWGIAILSRKAGSEYILHLIPFSTWRMEQGYLVLWIENILMTVPLGILLYILWKPCQKICWSLLIGCLFSLTIECIQLFTRRGKFETDDIMNNVFGVLLGFLLCKVIHRIFVTIKRLPLIKRRFTRNKKMVESHENHADLLGISFQPFLA